jgi:hypothetical protein
MHFSYYYQYILYCTWCKANISKIIHIIIWILIHPSLCALNFMLSASHTRLSRPILGFSHSTCWSHSNVPAYNAVGERGLTVVITVDGMSVLLSNGKGTWSNMWGLQQEQKWGYGVQCYPIWGGHVPIHEFCSTSKSGSVEYQWKRAMWFRITLGGKKWDQTLLTL